MTDDQPTAELTRILLVDDEPTNLSVLLQTLDGRGHELLIARTGEEALQIARDARPTLILLDIMMPGIDGFETCRRLKADPATRQSSVIFLSALDDVADKVEGFGVGAVDYIPKPFQVEEVLARVDARLTMIADMRTMQREVETLRESSGEAAMNAGHIRALIACGEGDDVEFKSTLRWNLRADRADKAMEDACLKTMVAFLNTDGGTLLVGVADDGAILGIEADRFPSNDRFLLHVNTMIREHIGPEFAPFIDYALYEIDGREVLAITCRQSSEPAFLRRGGAEDLYVRIGPGSRKLTTREAIDYLAARK